MENTPEQNVNLEEIVEFEDDDVNTMEEKEVLEGEDATDHVIEDSMIEALPEPYVGMEFESPDDAQEYYNKYARFIGFGTRKNRLMRSRSNQAIIGQEFVCSKEGVRAKKYVNREDRIKKSIPDETREGWKAMLRISKKEEQKWVISGFYATHNHELATPKSTPLIRSHRKRSRVQKDLMDVLADSGVRPSKIVSVLSHESGGINNLNMTDRDVFNYLSLKRQKQIEKGDAQVMLDYFHDCQSKNPGFFYSIQTDVDGRLANCFWVDVRSRMAYKHFGDVVAFDPTYLTNKYRMPFVPFAGVNHHFQSVLFGCALLWDETEQSFIWLLRTWLEAMDNCPPKTVITDQDGSITSAIAKVLPNSTHHFCMWHIEKKFPENLSQVYHQNADFKKEFNNCIHNTVTRDDFEDAWMKVIQKYKLQGYSWLNQIYSIREKWVPAFLRAGFCAGMSTTQRSESLNKFFKDYVNASTPVSKFVLKFEEALENRYAKEREKNFKTMDSKPVLKTLYSMEAEASQIYTQKLFRMFQDELVHTQEYVAGRVNVDGDSKTDGNSKTDGDSKTYKVHEVNREKPVYLVTFDATLNEIEFNCHKFEFMGILCRHALTIFIKKRVFSLPQRYILSRWTRNAKTNGTADLLRDTLVKNTSESSTLWFNSVMLHSLALSEKATRSSKHYDHAVSGIKNLCAELDSLAIDKKVAEDIADSNALDTKDEGNASCTIMTLRDPAHVVTKGRPPSVRKKGSLEKVNKKSKTCSICKRKGHTKVTCAKHQVSNNQSDPHTINATEPQSSNQSADVMPDACKTT